MVQVARRDAGAAHRNFALLPGEHGGAIGVEDDDLRAAGLTHRPGTLCAPLDRVARHLVRCLGHAVGLDHRRVEQGFELAQRRRRQGRRGRAHEPETVLRCVLSIQMSLRQHRLVDGGHGGGPGRTELRDVLKEAWAVKTCGAHDAATAGDGRQQCAHQPVDVEQRHHVQATIGVRQAQVRGDGARRSEQIGFAQRHEFRSRRGARSLQQQRNSVRRFQRRQGCGCVLQVRCMRQPETSSGFGRAHVNLEQGQPQFGRRFDDRTRLGTPHEHALHAERFQLRAELGLVQCRVKRGADRRGRHAKCGRGRLRAVGQHHGDAGRWHDAHIAQTAVDSQHLVPQALTSQRFPARRQ